MEKAVRNWVMGLLAIFALQGVAWAGVQPTAAKSHKKYSGKALKKPHPRAHAKTRPARSNVAAAPEETGDHPSLKSSAALVIDQTGRTLYAKNITAVQPIASITKLMTAMIVLDAKLDPAEHVAITEDDVDVIKHTRSRLQVGSILPREDLMRLALMASENRAAAALGRAY